MLLAVCTGNYGHGDIWISESVIKLFNVQRALIVRKEHLDHIFDDGKVFEMRSTRTNIRGRVGLIEAGSGLVYGEVDLVGCGNAISDAHAVEMMEYHQVDNLELLKKWKYPWFLSNPVRYKEPVPYDHPAGAVIWVKLNNKI